MNSKHCVELKIPCKPEYVGVARLVVLGVASRMAFSYDDVEDLRLAVGEACTSAIERAKAANAENPQITIHCTMEQSDKLTIEIADNIPGFDSRGRLTLTGPNASEEQNIGALLMEILVDEIRAESLPDRGTTITMVKYAGR